MDHLSGSFFLATEDLALDLPGCRAARVGDYHLGAFSGALLPRDGLDRLSISFATLAVAPAAACAENAAVIEEGTLTVRGSDMNTQAIYYIVTEARQLVVFNDLFLARYLLEALGCEPVYDPYARAADLTFFGPVFRLRAGEELKVRVLRRAAARSSLASLSKRRTSRLLAPSGGFYSDIERSKSEVLGRLNAAVRRGIEGESTVHIALSGGIDSGTIACLISQSPCRLKAYTLSTDWGDEFAGAKETAAFLGIDLERIHVSKDDLVREIPAVIRFFHFIRPESVEIALVAHCLYRKLYERSPSPRLFLTGYGSDLLNAGGVTTAARMDAIHAALVKELERTQLSNELSGLAARRFGVRVVHPFLHAEVISCALRIPADHKVGGRHDKQYLREMMTGLLPEQTVWRKKLAAHHGTGLSAHLREVFRRRGDRSAGGYERMIRKVHEDIFRYGQYA